jgi:hypothetical protein
MICSASGESKLTPDTCPIWGTHAVVAESNVSGWLKIDSMRAGGRFLMPRNLGSSLANLTASEKAKITSWIYERQLSDEYPELSLSVAKSLIRRPSLSITARRDRALLFFARETHRPGNTLRFHGLVDAVQQRNITLLQVATESSEQNEANAFLGFLTENGYIKQVNSNYTLTMEGWLAAEQREIDTKASSQAFVAMWFDPSMDDLWLNGILPAISGSGYSPFRIDGKEHVNKIDDEIISEIRKSRFLVADFTSLRDMPRGGVYFEAGFAFGLNIPVIWMCRADLIDQVHFDTRQYNHITWTDSGDLRAKLKNRIGAVLGLGPLSALSSPEGSG